ncbi:Hypp729 [Branchiostoma lanceolatum]|uniref:Hypp729 protein n=1 Tax=Branchiostoma lanceolatum TaxID=7740 RepID=A0A8J9YPI4_BRALA|nr:Hypp729 [Branchiostoma lanceolatum]
MEAWPPRPPLTEGKAKFLSSWQAGHARPQHMVPSRRTIYSHREVKFQHAQAPGGASRGCQFVPVFSLGEYI